MFNNPSSAQTHNSRILLVENNQPNIMVAQAVLERLGYSYDLAVNGKEAVDLALEHHYEAILMDVQMPIMSGYEATTIIRKDELENNKPEVPIIAVTAHVFDRDREKCSAVGMNDYISKPFQVEEIQKKIKFWVDKQHSLMQA